MNSKIVEAVLDFMAEKGKTPTVIKRADLRNTLFSLVGSKPVSVITVTTPAMNKTGNPYYDKVLKVSNTSGMVGFDYEAAMDKRLGTDDFEASETYSQVILNAGRMTPLSEHKKDPSRVYLRMMSRASKSKYIHKETQQEIPKESLEAWIKASSPNPTNFRLFDLANIRAISIAGKLNLVSDSF